MTAKGTFQVSLSGPRERGEDFLAGLLKVPIAARACEPQAGGPGEESKGWVEASFHEGTDGQPSLDFQRACLERVGAVGKVFDFEIRSYGSVISNASDLMQVVDKRTGEVVMKSFGGNNPEALEHVAWALGIDVSFLEFQEPPGVWDLPDS